MRKKERNDAQSLHITLITKENPGCFSFAGSLHGCLDCTMKLPCKIPEFLKLLQDIRRSQPISIAENNKAVQGFAAGTKGKDVNLGLKGHSVPKCVYCLGSNWQPIHLSISEKELCFYEQLVYVRHCQLLIKL